MDNKRGFTVLFVFWVLMFTIFFAFLTQTNQILELSHIQKKIFKQLKYGDVPVKYQVSSQTEGECLFGEKPEFKIDSN